MGVFSRSKQSNLSVKAVDAPAPLKPVVKQQAKMKKGGVATRAAPAAKAFSVEAGMTYTCVKAAAPIREEYDSVPTYDVRPGGLLLKGEKITAIERKGDSILYRKGWVFLSDLTLEQSSTGGRKRTETGMGRDRRGSMEDVFKTSSKDMRIVSAAARAAAKKGKAPVSDAEVLALVQAMRADNPAIGVKRIAAQLQADHPQWAVGCKEVRRVLKGTEAQIV